MGLWQEGRESSFLVDGELRSRTKSIATAFGRRREDGLDMRRRGPGLLGRFGGIVEVHASTHEPLRRRGDHPQALDLGEMRV